MTLRELLYEPWCRKHSHSLTECPPSTEASVPGDIVRSLATRMPECVPAGLKFNTGFAAWTLNGDDGVDVTTNDTAELLCIGRWVQVLGEARTTLHVGANEGDWQVITCDSHDTAPSLPAALAAANHKLEDEREKVTTDA